MHSWSVQGIQLKYFSTDEPGFKNRNPHRMQTEILLLADEIRERCGFPIRVSSGFRTPEENLRVNGSQNSPHMRGTALDLVPVPFTFRNRMMFLNVVSDIALSDDRIGFGIYNRHFHVDTDTFMHRPHLWTGSSS